MSNERLAVDLSDGDLVILGSVGSGKNKEYKESYIKKIDSDEPSVIADEVAAYIEREAMPSPQIIIVLDSRSILIKSFFFPFKGSARIESALDFELENSIPVDLESLYVDWGYGASRDRGAFVVAGCIENEVVENFKSAFLEKGLKLENIYEGAAPLIGFLDNPDIEKNKVVIDLGKERSAIYSFDGELLQHRDVLLHGTNLVLSDAENSDAASRLLCSSDFSSEELGEEEKKIVVSLNKLISRIKSYIYLYSEKTGFMPDVALICGQGAEITGIEELIGKSLNIRTVRFMPHDVLTFFEDNHEAVSCLKAFGLLQKIKGDRLEFLNLDSSGDDSVKVRALKYYLGWCAVLLISLFVYFSANIYYKSRIVSKTEDRINAILSESIPGIQKNFSHTQRVSILTSRMNKLERKLKNNSGGSGSAIEVLRVVNAAVAKSLKVTLDELTLDSKRLALSGSANNFKDVELLRNQLNKTGFFDSVSIKGATAEKKTKKVRFTIEMLRKTLGV
ncbi:PilN domain-containing protein [Maridesulfovibrio bastinii]|uniref:PilN domain-containing protein n=1 Tax=Maridesulfovibrio bastinii TaxID=47157 RepID=UPI00040FFFBB|nr:PilN domain-containing protein [Maridesulfovibrio bastinii]